MITLKNILVGSAAVAGVATVAGNLTSLPDDEHRAAEQVYFADDPTERSPTYGGVLPGQVPLIKTHAAQSTQPSLVRPDPQPRRELALQQSSPRPPSSLRDPQAVKPAYGGALSTIALDEVAPNLSQFATPADPRQALITPSFTGIPELDEVLKNGSLSIPLMVDALRQSGQRVARMSPGNTTEFVLSCLSNFNDPGCSGIKNEVEGLHSEMTKISAGILPQ